MWRYALLGAGSLAAASNSHPNNAKNGNFSVSAESGSRSLAGEIYSAADAAPFPTPALVQGSSSVSNGPTSGVPNYSASDLVPSYDVTTVKVVQIETHSTSLYASIPSSSDTSSSFEPVASSISVKADSSTWSSRHSTRISAHAPSQALYPYQNATRTSSGRTSTITPIFRGQCTGCALAALNPVTTSYESNIFGNWTSLVVTETILTEFVTYVDNSTVDTVVTEIKTVNQTKTANGYITDTAAEFNIYLPSPGLDLTLDVGPTYVIYTSLYGGPDVQAPTTARNNATDSKLEPTHSTCRPHVKSLSAWLPTRTQDWDFFIQTFANGSTPEPTTVNSAVTLPTKLQDFLAQDPDLQLHFQGADIATCTLALIPEELIGDPSRTFLPPAPSAPALSEPVPTSAQATSTQAAATSFSPPAFSSVVGTNTFLQTTFESTSKHITKLGCLRCDTNAGDRPEKTPKPDLNTDKINNDPASIKSPEPKNDNPAKSNDKPGPDGSPKTDSKPQDRPQNTPQNPSKPDVKTTPSIPEFISSVISDNPNLTKDSPGQPTDTGHTITIGGSVVTVKPQPTKPSQGGPDQEANAPTMVIIGTQTLTVGQTTTINGVTIVVPTAGGGSTIIVGDKSIGINPHVTQAPMPVLTVGYSTITANPEGQFVIGTQTLHRGGPLVVLDDNTLTLGPNGKIAIWNSATQTLLTMNGQPAATFGGQGITAKVLGGPGSAVTVDGTIFSLPSGFHGSSIVINGQTQRLGPVTATVASGITEYVLAPGQTLTPGGELTFSGTTYSLPVEGQGSTIVINGATSRLNPSHLPVLPLNNEEVTATVAHGTTAFVFGPDQTLTPGGVITVSGTTYSLPASASGTVVIINGVTSTLALGSGMGPSVSAAPIVVDGQTITATTRDGTVEYVLNSATTLFAGGQVVIDGTTYSLAPGGTGIVVNGKTSVLSSAPASNTASTTSSETTSDFIATGNLAYSGGADKWVESLVIGAAGWLLWLA
ncbi:hypothetical protein C7974DRAFT_400807 [Boeremia exigua]|uniref:uncharacterized protein n=1 Tax=Boeremia exigua TaxID=749465 RepID=UPI001E8DB809|nr:uncharacterized protein C7974DRAFT_400807 [Boeremia exigua]KAH6618751.1 hypothetical protein C7974DRAFT_400807 [Boeremia exigua]